jgi:hypothetical protein
LTLGDNTQIKDIYDPLDKWTNTDTLNCAVDKNALPTPMIGIDKNINGDALDGVLPQLVEYIPAEDVIRFTTSHYNGGTITI